MKTETKKTVAPVELAPVETVEPALEPAQESEQAPAPTRTHIDLTGVPVTLDTSGRAVTVPDTLAIRRDDRIPVPCFVSKTGSKDSVRYSDESGYWSQTVGTSDSLKVTVSSTCLTWYDETSKSDVVSLYIECMSGYTGFTWAEVLDINVPDLTFRILGLFGIAERIQTNCRKKDRTSLYGVAFALVNGGFNLSTVSSWIAETEEERKARIELEKATELEQFRSLALETAGISEAQRNWVQAMPAAKLSEITSNLMLSEKWGNLLDRAKTAGFRHIVTDISRDEFL